MNELPTWLLLLGESNTAKRRCKGGGMQSMDPLDLSRHAAFHLIPFLSGKLIWARTSTKK